MGHLKRVVSSAHCMIINSRLSINILFMLANIDNFLSDSELYNLSVSECNKYLVLTFFVDFVDIYTDFNIYLFVCLFIYL